MHQYFFVVVVVVFSQACGGEKNWLHILLGKNDPEKFLLVKHPPFPGGFFSVSHCRNVFTHWVFLCIWLQCCPECLRVVQSFVHMMKSKFLCDFKKRSNNWPLSIPAFTGKSKLFPWVDVSWPLIADFIYWFINFSLAGRATSAKSCWPIWQKEVNHREKTSADVRRAAFTHANTKWTICWECSHLKLSDNDLEIISSQLTIYVLIDVSTHSL